MIKINQLRGCVFVVLCGALSTIGCAPRGALFKPVAGISDNKEKGVIYFYRPSKFLSKLVPIPVEADNQTFAIRNGNYEPAIVSPGKYAISIESGAWVAHAVLQRLTDITNKKSKLNSSKIIEVLPGSSNYIRLEPLFGGIKADPIAYQEAKEELEECNLND